MGKVEIYVGTYSGRKLRCYGVATMDELPNLLRELLTKYDAVMFILVPDDPLERLKPLPTLGERVVMIAERLKSLFREKG